MTPSRILLSILSLVSTAAWAEDGQPDVAGSLAQVVLGLVVVVGLLLVALWLIKRLSLPRGAASGLKVVGAVAVGTRERVVLVELADQVLVLGVTPGSVRTLHTMPVDALHLARPPHAELAAPGTEDFPGWLRRALGRRNDAH